MKSGFSQVTPTNADALLTTLQRMAARGPVSVASQGVVGGRPFNGNLTFGFGTLDGVQILEARSGGLIMSTPVMPTGFVPTREGEVVAGYRIEDNVVRFHYEDYRGTAWRRFVFTP